MWVQVGVEERWGEEGREINKEWAGGALFGKSKGRRGAFPLCREITPRKSRARTRSHPQAGKNEGLEGGHRSRAGPRTW